MKRDVRAKKKTSSAGIIVAFVAAIGLLLFGSIGGARAALTYFSETYSSQVEMFDIGVTLKENGEDVSWRDYEYTRADGTWKENTGVLLANMLGEDENGKQEQLQLGKAYKEELNVRNSGTINQYVRVTVYRYWVDENSVDADGNMKKDLAYDPAYIELNFTNIGSAWLEDTNARTPERTVLYYNKLLNAGEETPLFADKLTINGGVALQTQQTELPDGTIQTIYEYDGARFCLEARVDAVQENNAEAAALSAWGRQVSIDEDAGILNLR